MQFHEQDIRQIAMTVWESYLGLMLESQDEARSSDQTSMAGEVIISGAWQGVVKLLMSEMAARQAAAVMFDIDLNSVTDRDASDATMELTNMVGGNLKSLIAQPCKLSVPMRLDAPDSTQATGSSSLADTNHSLLTRLPFTCAGEPIVVEVLVQEQIIPADGLLEIAPV